MPAYHIPNESIFFTDIYSSGKMSIAKSNKQKHKEDYIKYRFPCFQKDGEYTSSVWWA